MKSVAKSSSSAKSSKRWRHWPDGFCYFAADFSIRSTRTQKSKCRRFIGRNRVDVKVNLIWIKRLADCSVRPCAIKWIRSVGFPCAAPFRPTTHPPCQLRPSANPISSSNNSKWKDSSCTAGNIAGWKAITWIHFEIISLWNMQIEFKFWKRFDPDAAVDPRGASFLLNYFQPQESE